MPKKRRSSSSSNLIESEKLLLPNLPPWYIRVFIYCIVIFCFVLVFTLGPEPFSQSNEPSNEYAVKDQNGKVKTTNDAPYQPKIVDWNTYPSEELTFRCFQMGTKQGFIMCSRDDDYQLNKRNLIINSGLVENFQEVLEKYPNAGLFDIGANEGFFTLLAAKLGRLVVAVEPFTDNILLIQESARRNELTDKIILIQNAISNKYEKIPFLETSKDELPKRQTIYAESVTLDDIMTYTAFNEIILRIDIGGEECMAFEKASKLFHVAHVHQVFMEWNLSTKVDEKCVENMMQIFKEHHFRPFSLSGIELQPYNWKTSWSKNYIQWKQ